jgi:hypothetical protein
MTNVQIGCKNCHRDMDMAASASHKGNVAGNLMKRREALLHVPNSLLQLFCY